MGTSSCWEVNSIDLLNFYPTIISQLTIEKEMSAFLGDDRLKFGLSELYFTYDTKHF